MTWFKWLAQIWPWDWYLPMISNTNIYLPYYLVWCKQTVQWVRPHQVVWTANAADVRPRLLAADLLVSSNGSNDRVGINPEVLNWGVRGLRLYSTEPRVPRPGSLNPIIWVFVGPGQSQRAGGLMARICIWPVLNLYCTQPPLYSTSTVLNLYCTQLLLYSTPLYSTSAVLNLYCTQSLLHSTSAVLNLYCTQPLLYSTSAVLNLYCTQPLLYSSSTVLNLYCTQPLRTLEVSPEMLEKMSVLGHVLSH